MSTNIPLCADCHHLQIQPSRRPQALCAAPGVARCPISGRAQAICEIERSSFKSCGEKGMLFTPRDQDTWVPWVEPQNVLTKAGWTPR